MPGLARIGAAIGLGVLMGTLAVVQPDTLPVAEAEGNHPMYLGVHEQYQAGKDRTTPDETKKRYPLVQLTREFKGGVIEPQNLNPSTKNLCQKVWDAGLICNVSFKFSVAEVLNGKWQPFIEQWAATIRDSGRSAQTILTIWHEPENDKHFNSPEQFVLYFNQVHDWVKAVDPSILTCHAALGYRYRDNGEIDSVEATKWVTKADINSIDIYSGRSFPLDMTLKTSTGFSRWLGSRPGGSKWAVSERGWIAGSDKSAERVASINAEFDWLTSLDLDALPYFYIVWSTEGTEADPLIPLDEAGREAVNEGFARINAKLNPQPTTEPKPTPSVGCVQCPTCNGVGTIPSSWSVTTTISTVGKSD